MFQTIKEKFGRLDVILNNAGIAIPVGKLHETPLPIVEKTFDLNQMGAWRVLKCVPSFQFAYNIRF